MRLWLVLGLSLLAGCTTAQGRREQYVHEAQAFTAGERTRRAILEGKIHIGMSMPEVQASWGIPDDRDTYMSRELTTVVWMYRVGEFEWSSVTFEGGLVSLISN